LTHSPKKEHKSSQLTKNPNPSDTYPSHLQHKVKTTQKKYLPNIEPNWSFAKEDLPLVRHLKKQYKKRQNKKRR